MTLSIRQGLAMAALIAGLGMAAPALAQTASPAPASANTALNIMQASAALSAGKCADALPALAALWDDASLSASDPDLAAQMRFQRVVCTGETAGIKAALVLSSENLKRAPVAIGAYDLHIFLLLGDNQLDGAADTLDAALTALPKDSTKLTDISVLGVILLEQAANPVRANALMNHLEEDHWQVHQLPLRSDMDILRLMALRAALKANDTAHAAMYRADIATDSFIYVLSEGDGDVSDAATPAQPIGPVIDKEIGDVKVYLGQNNADLIAYSYLLQMESSDQQDDIASRQATGLIALIDQHGIAAFAATQVYPQILAQRGELLANLGQSDAALAAFQDGATRIGNGQGTAEFYGRYINYLIGRGQYTQALTLTGTLNVSSLHPGQAVALTQTLACAFAGQGDKANYARALGVLPDHNLVRVKPQLCAGDLDGAAANLIAAMNDKASRDEAIIFLQDTLPAMPYSDSEKPYIAATQALKARPDVLAAAQAAHIVVRTWPLRF